MDKPPPISEEPEPLPDEDAQPGDDPLTAQLVAYLDGELDPHECEAVEAKINLDPQVRSKVEALKQTWALLDHLPRPEPSPRFTERTMVKLEAASGSPPKQGSAKSADRRTQPAGTPKSGTTSARSSSTLAMPPKASSKWMAPVGLLLLGIAATTGYFLRAAVLPTKAVESAPNDPKIEDLHLLRNFRLYQHVNDVEFLKALDHPELFGDGSLGS